MNWPLFRTTRDTSADQRLMRQVQLSADPAAFAQLVDRWQTPIRRLCVRMSGDEHRGEDLAQETFARVFAKRQTFQPERTFSTWLWRIAINVCHESARRRRVDSVETEPTEWTTPHDRAVSAENVRRVRWALSQLDEDQRAVVVLREYESLKFREIAEVLGVPEGTLKWRMAEALKMLGALLSETKPRV